MTKPKPPKTKKYTLPKLPEIYGRKAPDYKRRPKKAKEEVMTEAPRAYELWDFETGNCVGVYGTLDEALDIVEKGVAGMSRAEAVAWVGDLALLIHDKRHGDEAREKYEEGVALLDATLERRKP